MKEKQDGQSVPAAFDPAGTMVALSQFPPQAELTGAVTELERELQVRDRCYARWVSEGRLAKQDAADRYNRLQWALAAVKTLLDFYPADVVPVPYGNSREG